MNSLYDALAYYAVLNVSPKDDISIIKRQYYDRAKFWHPDHNKSPKAVEFFQKVSIAYEILSNPKTRIQYDLLSTVYTKKDFPAFGALKIYKNQSDKDDIALRVLKQKKVRSNIIKCEVKETKDICNIKEAGNMVLSTSIFNWLSGWWAKDGIKKTIEAFKFNMKMAQACDIDNLKLLIHNAIAYEQENNKEMAWIYAKQAEEMVKNDEYLTELLEKYISILDYSPQRYVTIPYWNTKELRLRQLLFPSFLGILVLFATFLIFVQQGVLQFNKEKSDGYYEAILVNGVIVPSDMIETHVLQLDSTPHNKEYLVHLNKDCIIYYGPDKRYTPMRDGKKGQTVRITGYTYNKAWYRIVIDNGEIGYIHKSNISKGIGNPVPPNSHVYKG